MLTDSVSLKKIEMPYSPCKSMLWRDYPLMDGIDRMPFICVEKFYHVPVGQEGFVINTRLSISSDKGTRYAY